MAVHNSKGSKRTQLDKFKDAARELECDEDEETFKRALRKVARAHKPKPEKSE